MFWFAAFILIVGGLGVAEALGTSRVEAYLVGCIVGAIMMACEQGIHYKGRRYE